MFHFPALLMSMALTAGCAQAAISHQGMAAKDGRTMARPVAATAVSAGVSAPAAKGARIDTGAQADFSRQRQLYQQALDAMEKRQTGRLESLKAQLRDYPLYPYLEYEDVRRRVLPTSGDLVRDFLSRYPDSPLAFQLRDQWLATLARHGRWSQFLTDYTPDMRSTGMKCYYNWALLQTGKTEQALKAVPELWLAGRSLPDACDPLIAAWRQQGGVTEDLLRQRIGLAVQAGNWSLATYLARDLPKDQRALMDLYRRVLQQPNLLAQTDKFRTSSPMMRQIILHGMQRYIRKDAEVAAELWRDYRRLHDFSPEERAQVSHSLALYLATSYHPDSAQLLSDALADRADDALYEWRVRIALRKADWQDAVASIGRMPESLRQSPRWQYWLARALESQGGENRLAQARDIYTTIAKERDYYGFLAADRIGAGYTLNHRPFPLEPTALERVAKLPGIQRVYEFYQLGMIADARREWRFVTKYLPTEDILAASNLVQQWGWYSQSIQGAIAAKEWDDLQVRFPLVYHTAFAEHAEERNLDVNWVLALARQESAFMPDARSPKGALGLLQLMPATAKQTARAIGKNFRDSYELLNPEINIQLGTAHLNDLLGRFNNNRILATAAYNAGAGKVRQWLDNGGDRLSYDVWIETMPYYETRQYVQNVLAYSVIYGYRRGKNPRLLVDHEIACVCLNRTGS